MTAFSLLTKNNINSPDIIEDHKVPDIISSMDQIHSFPSYAKGQKRPLPDRVYSNIQPSKKIKQQASYMKYKPHYEMSKEELTEWKREQRKIRNRQSAAASRQKVRNHIEALENQLHFLQHKYEAVVDKLKKYEPSFDESIILNRNRGVISPSISPSPESQTNNNIIKSSITTVDCSDEPKLVEEVEKELNYHTECINKSNNFMYDGISDDEELGEFLSYAFSESQ